MRSPVWLRNGGSTGGEFGLAQLDPEEAVHPRPSCAGVGAETCPAAKAVRGRLWARSSGEWQGMVLPVVLQLDLSEDISSQPYPWKTRAQHVEPLWAAHPPRSWHGLELGLHGLKKEWKRLSNPNNEAFLLPKLLNLYQMC